MRYLYGASVQGIQDFIFQTNALAEIVGASELVEEICTTKFVELLVPDQKFSYLAAKKFLRECSQAIVNAAGNITYVFNSRQECEKVVAQFPRVIAEFAPGVTVSQAVVQMDQDMPLGKADSILKEKLKIQRNKPSRSATLGMMGIQRSRQTGLSVIAVKDNQFLDKCTAAKLYDEKGRRWTTYNLSRKAFGIEDLEVKRLPFDMAKIPSQNDWIAIVHADGNGLGNLVKTLALKLGATPEYFDIIKDFSQRLDEATTNAAVKAYQRLGISSDEIIPIRPIVLGGDDLTVICRGDLAIPYTVEFIREFEKETERLLGPLLSRCEVFTEGKYRTRLTACAGIAYIKSSYPFYYGYELAEQLCATAKRDAKNAPFIRQGKELPQSCVLFHKVQGSFTGNYDDIVRRELCPQKDRCFSYGPYYLSPKEERWTIDDLTSWADRLSSDQYGSLKSRLRNWISAVFENQEQAKQELGRIISLNGSLRSEIKELTQWVLREDGAEDQYHCPAYDVLTVSTINNQETRK